MILTYKYRIKDRSARKTLCRHAYAVNQVFNWCVAQQRDLQARYKAGARKRKWLATRLYAVRCDLLAMRAVIFSTIAGRGAAR